MFRFGENYEKYFPGPVIFHKTETIRKIPGEIYAIIL